MGFGSFGSIVTGGLYSPGGGGGGGSDPGLPAYQRFRNSTKGMDANALEAQYNRYALANQLSTTGEFSGTAGSRGGKVAGNRMSYISNLLQKQGITPTAPTGLDATGNPDYSATSGAAQTLRQLAGVKGQGALWDQKTQRYISGKEREISTADYNKNTAPALDSIDANIQDMLSHPGMSGEEVANIRSGIIQNAKNAESSRLKRVAAVLGQRGLDPSTATGSSLAAHTAEESDKALQDSLREFGINTDEFARNDREKLIGLASQSALSRVSARNAALNNDKGAMAEAQTGISSLVAAIQQQNELRQLYDSMYRTQQGGLAGAGAGALSGVAAGSSLGPWGMAAGGLVGGVSGYFSR